jgi:type II secretory pathway component PulK
MRRGANRNDERGIALIMTVFALAVIGALVASSFFAGRLEQQSGQSTFFAAQAREAAEAALTETMQGLRAETLDNLHRGGPPLQLGTTLIGNGVTARSQVTRLTSRVFLIRTEGQRLDAEGTALATRSLGLLVQLSLPTIGEPGSSGNVMRLGERAWLHLY